MGEMDKGEHPQQLCREKKSSLACKIRKNRDKLCLETEIYHKKAGQVMWSIAICETDKVDPATTFHHHKHT